MNKLTLMDFSTDQGMPFIYDAEVTCDEINNTRMVLKHSVLDASLSETYKNKVAVELHDHGNGVSIAFPDTGEETHLDYCQVLELRMLLNYYNEDAGNAFTSKTKKFKEV